MATRPRGRTATGRICSSGRRVGTRSFTGGRTVGLTGDPARTRSNTRPPISGGHPATDGRPSGLGTSTRAGAATLIGRARLGNRITTGARRVAAGATGAAPARTRFPTTVSGGTPRRTTTIPTVSGPAAGSGSASKGGAGGPTPEPRPTGTAARPATRDGTPPVGGASISGATRPTITGTVADATPAGGRRSVVGSLSRGIYVGSSSRASHPPLVTPLRDTLTDCT